MEQNFEKLSKATSDWAHEVAAIHDIPPWKVIDMYRRTNLRTVQGRKRAVEERLNEMARRERDNEYGSEL